MAHAGTNGQIFNVATPAGSERGRKINHRRTELSIQKQHKKVSRMISQSEKKTQPEQTQTTQQPNHLVMIEFSYDQLHMATAVVLQDHPTGTTYEAFRLAIGRWFCRDIIHTHGVQLPIFQTIWWEHFQAGYNSTKFLFIY
jgi:hypothetical protein